MEGREGTTGAGISSQISQSLFQVLYLGHTTVDRHCSPAVMQWIIEELKLRTEQRVLSWLTPGVAGLSHVADSGQELFHHPYSQIIRCASASDVISFSYILQGDDDQYTCHVFQCLIPDEAAQVMKKLKQNGRGDHKTTSPRSQQLPPDEYHVRYLGCVELDSATPSNDLLDNALEKVRRKQRRLNRKEVSAPLIWSSSEGSSESLELTNRSESPKMADISPLVSETKEPTSVGGSTAESGTRASPLLISNTAEPPQSPDAQSITSLTDRQMPMTREDSCEVAIKVTRATPERIGLGVGKEEVERKRERKRRRKKEEREERMEEEEEEEEEEERYGTGGKEGEKNETSVQSVAEKSKSVEGEEQSPLSAEPPSPSVSTPGWSDGPSSIGPDIQVLYPSLPEGDAHQMSGSSSSTTPDLQLESAHPITISQHGKFGRHVLDEDERPASCPLLDNYATEELTVSIGEEEEEEGEGEEEEEQEEEEEDEEEGRVSGNAVMASSSTGNLLTAHEKTEKKNEKNNLKISLGRSHSFGSSPVRRNKSFQGEGEEEEETDVGYDTLPELQSLQGSPVFQALGHPPSGARSGRGGRGKEGREVCLMISSAAVTVTTEKSKKVILRRSIRSIACCAQGQKWPVCVGFISREGQVKKFFCHIFRAETRKMASAVMDSFKSSFVQALNSSPSAMCESCPLQQLHQLCQNIEGVDTPVAQSRIQECLLSLSEADYNAIMQQYKSSEHADHEFTQLVVLVSLIREHLQKKQQEHIHPIVTQPDTSATNHLSVQPKLSKLERAKLALTSSFESLRNRGAEKRARQMGRTKTLDESGGRVPPLASEDRRASASVTERKDRGGVGKRGSKLRASVKDGGESSGGEEQRGRAGSGEKRGRTGSWLSWRSSKAASSSQEDVSDGEKLKGEEEEGKKGTSPLTSPQSKRKVKPARKLEPKEDEGSRSDSRTPSPASQPLPPEATVSRTPPPSSPPRRESDVFKTPSRTPNWRKPNMRSRAMRSRTTMSLGRPPSDVATSPAVKKLWREHKRSDSMSWRHEIFESVTPVREGSMEKIVSFQDWEIIETTSIDQLCGKSATLPGGKGGEVSPRVIARQRWKRAIEQQIMLLRMEKENLSIQRANTEADIKRIKLCYKDPSLDDGSVGKTWAELLSQPHPEQEELQQALLKGIPPGKRGEVWSFLIQLYQERTGQPAGLSPTSPHSFGELCLQTTEYEHAIEMDLGRTFPSHPYFSSQQRWGGQQALFDILRAYAVSDPETGYCQGLSFIGGILLMHTKDEELAFKLLCQFMHVYNYRDVYAPDLSMLQLRLYQLSRLLHDDLSTLHDHLSQHEITPFYYAAPWFLTLFASQYPIAFVARVMDMFFFDGPDVVFKVAVAMLHFYEDRILQCHTMECISEFLKDEMPQLVLDNMVAILGEALKIDLGNKLQSYETEYVVLEELTTSFQLDTDAQDLKSLNESLRNYNKELIDQLALCRGLINSLESKVASLQEKLKEQDQRLERLEAAQTTSSTS